MYRSNEAVTEEEPEVLVARTPANFRTLFDEAAFARTLAAVADDKAVKAVLPFMVATLTMFGAAIFFSYPKTIDMAIALPVVTPLD